MKTRNFKQLETMDVLLLCGGMGSRLQSAVSDRPKPMADFQDRPFLDILIDYFRGFGPRRFILCTGHLSDYIEDYYRRKDRDRGIEMIISKEDRPLGTAGAVKNAGSLIQSENFIVTNGDSFCPADLDAFARLHFGRHALATISVNKPDSRSDTGTVQINEQGQITTFAEKSGIAGDGYVNCGIYLFNQDILSRIEAEKKVSLETEVFPSLCGGELYACVTEAELIDIGTPQRLEQARALMKSK